MTDTKIKALNQPGDYYFCPLCAAWHRCTNDLSSTGNQHLSHLDEKRDELLHLKIFLLLPLLLSSVHSMAPQVYGKLKMSF